MKYVAPSAPLSIGGVLDDWIRLFRSTFRACWPIALIASIAGAIVQFTVTPMLPRPHQPALQYYMQYWASMRAPAAFLTSIVFWLVLLVVYGALLTQQGAVIRGEEPFSFGDALGKGLRRVPQLLLGIVLLILIYVAVWVPIGIGAAVMLPFRHRPGEILIAALGITAAVILMIYLSVRLQLWMAVSFAENRGGAESLGRSWELVKGHWWRVAGIGFVSGIVIWILGAAIAGVLGMGVGFMAVHGTSPEQLIRRMRLIGTIGGLARLLTMPLLTAVWLAIYHDLKLRREGGDLAARAEALSSK